MNDCRRNDYYMENLLDENWNGTVRLSAEWYQKQRDNIVEQFGKLNRTELDSEGWWDLLDSSLYNLHRTAEDICRNMFVSILSHHIPKIEDNYPRIWVQQLEILKMMLPPAMQVSISNPNGDAELRKTIIEDWDYIYQDALKEFKQVIRSNPEIELQDTPIYTLDDFLQKSTRELLGVDTK